MSSRSRQVRKARPIAPSPLVGEGLDASLPADEPSGTAPFRPLDAVTAEIRRFDRRPVDLHAVESGERDGGASPSGLLTRRAWEADLTDLYGEIPSWYGSSLERDRQFARWVQAEAKNLAMRLERLLDTEGESTLAPQTRAIAEALWADADWARYRLDGSLDD
ncbi:hypothetical protein [Rhodospirillaceae bacterium SYSU D60014]|uniref:hypothetical protein n=1 Tax=Virgifigura deserti TaxID=2268457 RepID=UPI0013C4596F